MADLFAFPINARWPAANPDVIQLYSFPTPNGQKVSIALEEFGLAYGAPRVFEPRSDRDACVNARRTRRGRAALQARWAADRVDAPDRRADRRGQSDLGMDGCADGRPWRRSLRAKSTP